MTLRRVDVVPDTITLGEACARLGVSYSTGVRLARADLPLIPGVTILRIGAVNTQRPAYRVIRAQLDRALGVAP